MDGIGKSSYREKVNPESPRLSLWDTVSIIVGIVIGAGIFETAPLIFSTVNHSWLSLGLWIVGGVLSLVGALCYAELASAYPKSGGDYVYLSRSYGPWMGFFFGWTQLAVILTGSIGMTAYIFADYAGVLWKTAPESSYIYAVSGVVALSLLNIFGVVLSKKTQNILSVTKMIGLLLVILAGGIAMLGGASGSVTDYTLTTPSPPPQKAEGGLWNSLGLALIFVLYAYGGWNDAAFVTAEMRDRRRNIPRALILGTLSITFIYLLINAAYLVGLGLEGAKRSEAIAADLLRWPLGNVGADAMSLIVIVCALSALNGLIFTGSRVFSAMGSDHRLFAVLSYWNSKTKTPIWSILAQSMISIGLIVAVGSSVGQQWLSTVISKLGFEIPVWQGRSGFETLLLSTAPVFWLFFLLTGLSLFILRKKEPHIERPFRVPFYPVTPIIFCLTCFYMLYRSIAYAGALSLLGFILLLLGLPLYLFSNRLKLEVQYE